jgi:putative nucleotidyltransferase with HDIG domain
VPNRCSATEPKPRVELGQALFVLSDALDLVGVDDVFHGKRVAWLTQRIFQESGHQELVEDAWRAAVIHDCGVSSTRHHLHLVDNLGVGDSHCATGAALVARFGPLVHLSEVIRHHHTPWAQLGRVEPRVALLANGIFLADRIDVLQARHRVRDSLLLRSLVRSELLEPYDHLFHAPLVDAAWRTLDDPEVVARVLENGAALAPPPSRAQRLLEPREVLELAHLFAKTVDAKSAYTAAHSHGVAALAVDLGTSLGLTSAQLHVLEVAALLHDLGKLRVPDEVLDKPGPLTGPERVIMRSHAESSRRILERIEGFEVIARVAGMHHELLDGSGYPDGRCGDEIPLGARIITVADIFQALAQDRPYRSAMHPDEIAPVLRGLAGRGKIDAQLVELVCSDLPRSWGRALAEPPELLAV